MDSQISFRNNFQKNEMWKVCGPASASLLLQQINHQPSRNRDFAEQRLCGTWILRNRDCGMGLRGTGILRNRDIAEQGFCGTDLVPKRKQGEAMDLVTFGLSIPLGAGLGSNGKQWEAMDLVTFGLGIPLGAGLGSNGKQWEAMGSDGKQWDAGGSWAYITYIAYITWTLRAHRRHIETVCIELSYHVSLVRYLRIYP